MAGFWRKALDYLGLVVEDDGLEPLTEVHDSPLSETVRPIRPNGDSGRRSSSGPMEVLQATPTVIPHQVRVHVAEPQVFNDAKEIGDKLRVDSPVVVNLQGCAGPLRQRIIDFASGLTYMAGGSISKVADFVFLLTPANVEVSAEETQRIISERGFFNQF